MLFTALAMVASSPMTLASAPERCEIISTINVIDVQPGMATQARAYYRKGWAAAREVALERGVIQSYDLLVSESGVGEDPEIILITNYASRAQFDDAEVRFEAIFKELNLPQPLLIEGLTRDDILGPVQGAADYRSVYSSKGNCGVPGHSDSQPTLGG